MALSYDAEILHDIDEIWSEQDEMNLMEDVN